MTSLAGWMVALLKSFRKVIDLFQSIPSLIPPARKPGVRLVQKSFYSRTFSRPARHVLAKPCQGFHFVPQVAAPVASNHIAMLPCPYFCNLSIAVSVFVFLLISCGCLPIFSERYVCIFPLTSQSWAILVSDFSLFIEMILFLPFVIYMIHPVRCSEGSTLTSISVYCIRYLQLIKNIVKRDLRKTNFDFSFSL